MESHSVTVASPGRVQPLAVGMSEAARLLGVSRMHIYRRLIPDGDLHTFMSGGRRLVRVAEIERYLADREAAA